MRTNPLLRESIAGLGGAGRAQLDYLGYMLIQAVVLFLWWPRTALMPVLESGQGPNTLLAVIMALGVTTAYYNVRAGSEELRLPDQQGLRDWAFAAALPLARVIRGYLLGQLLQTLHLIALSSPLVLIAFTVSGGEWAPLGWCIGAIVVQAVFYRLCAALVALLIGHHPAVTALAVRALIVVVYVPLGVLLPVTSQLAVSSRLLAGAADAAASVAPISNHVLFVLVYGLAGGVLAVALCWLLALRRRRLAGIEAAIGNRESTGR